MVEPTMPVVYFFAYFLLEALAFWAVSSWIGVGWALLVLFVTMFFGMTIAGVEARRIMRSRVRADDKGQLVYSDDKPGRTAGNVGLTMVGGVPLSIPGFVTTIVGLLLILPPTRSLIRTVLAARMFRAIERMGMRVYEATPMAQNHTSFGQFTSARPSQPGARDSSRGSARRRARDEDLVIDEDEIRRWSESADPDDFRPDSDNGRGRGGSGRPSGDTH